MTRSLSARTAALAVAGCALLGAVVPAAAAGPASSTAGQPRPDHHTSVRAGSTAVHAASDLTYPQMVARINADRARYGAPALALDTASSAALAAHANYIRRNAAADADVSTEEPTAPGYTPAGHDIAPYTTSQTSTSWGSALDGWLSDPWFRDVELLDPTVTSIGFGASGTTRVYSVQSTGDTPTGYPRTYPAGANVTELANRARWLSGDYGCRGGGFPISTTWDYTSLGQASTTSGRLAADGVSVASCMARPAMLGFAQAALVPSASLKPGTHYTGEISATLPVLAGGTRQVSRTIDFTTAAPATGVLGDQTGDRRGDVLAIGPSGDLRLYKSTGSALGHSWRVASNWGGFSWASWAGDVNRDGRTDLIARTRNGHLILYTSQGMGRFSRAWTSGPGFAGYRNPSVVGDINDDGCQDLVARTSGGILHRWSLTSRGLSAAHRMGRGWTSSLVSLAGVGSLNGDTHADILATDTSGRLWRYNGNAAGTWSGRTQVGSGYRGLSIWGGPDLNGDGRRELFSRDAAGNLYVAINRGRSLDGRTRIGTGWGPLLVA